MNNSLIIRLRPQLYGLYNPTVIVPGFAPYSVSGVDIATVTTSTVDVRLVLATAAQEVTVQAGAVLLQSNSSDVGVAVEEKLKNAVPNLVNGGKRTASSYVLMSPGVYPQGQLTIGGGRTLSTETMIDGQTMSHP